MPDSHIGNRQFSLLPIFSRNFSKKCWKILILKIHEQKKLINIFQEMQAKTVYAVCLVRENDNSGVSGVVTFAQDGDKTTISACIKGLTKGKHAIHIHEFGNLKEGCQSCGAHYNPFGKPHAGPKDADRHVGDMGNLESDGVNDTQFTLVDHLIRLTGEHNVLGRSVVIHKDEDDLGTGNFPDSKTTGHAGARIACGVIALSEKI